MDEGGVAPINFMWHLVWDYKAELFKGLLTAVGVSICALIISLAVGMLFALAALVARLSTDNFHNNAGRMKYHHVWNFC
jgi:ABC-type amino acid transport system permease subunit